MAADDAVDAPLELPPPHEASTIAEHAIKHDAAIPRA
jgi:hypothetical protein